MRKLISAIVLILIGTVAIAQNNSWTRKQIDSRADSIMVEGKALFRSEWASWYGTDIFMEKFKNKRSIIGGYLSYETDNGPQNIFYSKGDEPDVLATISFTKVLDPHIFTIDTTARKLNKTEKQLFILKQASVNRVEQDTIFKFYKNASANIIHL